MAEVKEKSPVQRRTKGEQTRTQILAATIEVLATHGIKGTTHRAVAAKAGIQLSLTTYYFKDIQELVHAAFELSSRKALEHAKESWQYIFECVDTLTKTNLRKVSVREQLRDTLTKYTVAYIVDKIKNQPTTLAVEQLLFTQVQVSPTLRELADVYRKELLAPYIKLSSYFNTTDPYTDAEIMLTMLTQLEYRNLTIDAKDLDIDMIEAISRRVLGGVMNLKLK